jgi:predicted nuclease of restriction endonuclease-like RecB superfamily
LNKTRNKFERRVELSLKRKKCKFKYEAERIPYIIAAHYIPDFILSTPNGKIYVECKGYLRPEDRRKLVAVKKTNPHIDLRILFYREVTTQVKWATKNGFKFAIEDIPEEWINGLG